jgi:predicted ArsR family transcriptional regulator
MASSDPGLSTLGCGLDALSCLAEPTRRAVYAYVASARGWVSRDEAATSLGLERGTVVHHLDRLVADGLLDVVFRRLSGRRGPGAGRPAKLYRRADRTFEVSLPQRDYELAGRLLAKAAETSATSQVDIRVAIDEVARAEGRRIAEAVRSKADGGDGSTRRTARLLGALREHGYEPHQADDGTVELSNCPFHNLAQEHTDLVCAMNLSLLDALAEEDGTLTARLEPVDGACCVRLHPKDPTLELL